MSENISVIGSGSWGVALAILLNSNGHNVKLWSYNPEEARMINEDKKCKFLPNITIPDGLECYTELEDALKDTNIVLIVTPSNAIRATLNNMLPFVTENQVFVLCSKGMEKDTQKVYTEVIKEVFPNNKVSALSGPSHAEEVSEQIPTAVVISSEDDAMSEHLQSVFMNPKFRVYINDDLLGVEMGGSLKNIIALACGIANGLGYGDNTVAALITRGIVEISRLGVEAGAKRQTFYGLTGVGDLFVTCSSMHSRNRRAGILIGQGKSVEEAVKEVGMVVEGINAVEGAYILAQKHSVSTPIINEMYDIIHKGKTPEEATMNLMSRGKKTEF
ncbi:MAG: NAD(P)-dependent glycerol-3-phosphate dehydrogenase [Clostridia bacterium]|nr:NAD(P)-dependent glycerol-3-phosphate dehydrogenase [Clostridia bacterium]